MFPGLTNAWTMPIKTRIDMLSTGIKTPVGIKIMGPELDVLTQLADLSIYKGPAGIKSENSRRTAWVYIDLKGIDIGSYVRNAKKIINRKIDIPTGYSIVWSGQYEYMEKARKTLQLIVPGTLVIIFILLYMHFCSIIEAVIVMASLPFALVGGVWLIYLLDYNLSVAVIVGFIALAGLAAEIGAVMLVYLDEVYERNKKRGEIKRVKDLYRVVTEGAVDRVRPKLMIVATTLIGLLPVMWGSGTGSQLMKRIAAPMVGGLISSTV